MPQATTLGIFVDRDWQAVYEAIWRPEAFPTWASGLAHSSLIPDGEWWVANGPSGPVRLRFTAHNEFGVLDHWVDLGGGRTVYVPFRVVAHGAGAELTLTVFRESDMSDDDDARDQDWVRRDLAALKAMLEAGR